MYALSGSKVESRSLSRARVELASLSGGGVTGVLQEKDYKKKPHPEPEEAILVRTSGVLVGVVAPAPAGDSGTEPPTWTETSNFKSIGSGSEE